MNVVGSDQHRRSQHDERKVREEFVNIVHGVSALDLERQDEEEIDDIESSNASGHRPEHDVQEGLGNVRRHANATRAQVVIGQRPSGERFVAIEDDGAGLPPGVPPGGQGLRNMRDRASSIEGGFSVRSTPGLGTALEVVLRT